MSKSIELPPRARQVLFLRAILGLSRKEAAQVSNLSIYGIRFQEYEIMRRLGARNWYMAGALAIAYEIFAPETVKVSAELGPPPIWLLLSKRTGSSSGGRSV